MMSRKKLIKEHAKEILRVQRSFVDSLIEQRHAQKKSQADIAEIMGVTQSAVSLFEHYDSNPTLSSIRRYALAVNADVVMQVKQRSYTAQVSAPTVAVRRIPRASQRDIQWDSRTLNNA